MQSLTTTAIASALFHMPIQALDFTVQRAAGPADLAQACQLRADAYGRHVPHLLGVLHHPDAIDRHPDTLVLLCRRKSDGRLLGTVRAQSNRSEPLAIQQAVNLPPWLQGMPVLEFTRLAIAADASAGVRLALAKACYLLCRATQTPWVMIGARSRALMRLYLGAGFFDVLAPDEQVPLRNAGGLPHRILAFDVNAARRTWQARRPDLFEYIFETSHPDLHAALPATQLPQADDDAAEKGSGQAA